MAKQEKGDVAKPDPTLAAHRSRAYNLRKRQRTGGVLLPSDADWLGAYEAAQAKRDGVTAFGASESEKIVHVEERHKAVGVGEAAALAAAQASVAREDGRRLDALLATAVGALERACGLHEKMAQVLLSRWEQQEQVHLVMLDTVREQYLRATNAEVAAAEAAGGGSAADDLLKMVIGRVIPNPGNGTSGKPV